MPSKHSRLRSPKQRHGGGYEQFAADFLQRQGLVVIARNWQQHKVGEIDLILLHPGRSWDTLVFAEVRKRKLAGYGDALMSVTKSKQRKLIKTAHYFMQYHPQYANLECRFDVVAYNETLKWHDTMPLKSQSNVVNSSQSNPELLNPYTLNADVLNPDLLKADVLNPIQHTPDISNTTCNSQDNSQDNNFDPEWVQGAFIASAW